MSGESTNLDAGGGVPQSDNRIQRTGREQSAVRGEGDAGKGESTAQQKSALCSTCGERDEADETED